MNFQDGEVVARHIRESGRDAVFDAAYAEFRQPLMNLCWRITGNWADGEDAFHDAMVNAYRGLAAFQGAAKFSTWIYRVAVRSSLRVRGRRRRGHVEIPPDLRAADEDPKLDQKEELAKVLQAMEALPDDSRVVLHLFALKHLSHAEIADVLGIPVGTVWSRLHRARRQLKAELESPRQGSAG